MAVVLHAGLAAAMTTIDPTRFRAETPIEIDVEEKAPPPPEVKPPVPEPPPPPRPEPRPRIAMRRAPTPPTATPPPEAPPPSETPPKADQPPPVFGVNLDSTVSGPGEGMAVPVGNTLMAKPGKAVKAAAPAPSGDGAGQFVPVADIYISKFAKQIFVPNGDDMYPEDAKRMGLEGVVVLKLGIDEKGKVVQVKVVERAGHGFDEAAVKAMWQSKFEPAIANDGRAVPTSFKFTYRFELNR